MWSLESPTNTSSDEETGRPASTTHQQEEASKEEVKEEWPPVQVPIGRLGDPASTASGSSSGKRNTVQDYARAYRSGAHKPSQVINRLLAAISNAQTVAKLGTVFVSVRSELVRAAAAASDLRFASGTPFSVFDGVPIAVKDMINVVGSAIVLSSFSPSNFGGSFCSAMATV